MEKTKSYNIIVRQGKKIKKIWKSLSLKYNVPIEITGLDSICSFNFLNKDSQILKAIFISEMLKKRFLANTTVYVSVAHTEKVLKKYKNALDKTFKIISNFDKKKLSKYKTIKLAYKGFYRLN